jgi:RNA polymerase sigma factor (sigma-70 family)
VKALPARQRAAVALRFYADLSVTETAEMMGCSVGAVKTHTTRALAKLREALVEDGES